MKNALLFVPLALLCGCATPLYRNGIPDASPITGNVSISELPSENAHFRVFRVNEYVALLKESNNSGRQNSTIGMLNSLLILSESQVEKLREVCKAIIAHDESKQTEGVRIFKYELVSNRITTEMDKRTAVIAVGNNVFADTKGIEHDYQHTYFALQFMSEKTSKGKIKTSITYIWRGGKPISTGKKEIRRLLSDISQ